MLSKEQFNNLRKQGLSIDQIVKFDKGEVPSVTRRPAGQRGFKEGWATAGWKGIKEGYKAAAVGAVSTLTKLSSFGERMLHKPSELFGVEPLKKTAAEELVPEKFRKLPEDASPAAKAGLVIEQAAEWFIPITKATKLAQLGKAGKVLEVGRRILDPTAKTALQADKLGTEEFATGAIIGAGGVLTHYGAKAFQYMPKWLMKKAVGKGDKIFKEGQSVEKYALENKMGGTAKHIFKKSEKKIEDTIMEMRTKIFKLGKKFENKVSVITPKAVQEEADKAITRFTSKAKDPLKMVKEPMDDLAYYFETQLDGFLKGSKMKLTEKQLGELRPLYSELFKLIALNKSMGKMMDKITSPLSIMNLLSGGIGSTSFGLFQGLPGVAEALITKKALTSTWTLTQAGIKLEWLRTVAPALQKLTPLEKGALSQIIQTLSK